MTAIVMICCLTFFLGRAEEPPFASSEKQIATERNLLDILRHGVPGDTVILQNPLLKNADEDIFLLQSGTDVLPVTLDGQRYTIQGKHPLEVSPLTMRS